MSLTGQSRQTVASHKPDFVRCAQRPTFGGGHVCRRKPVAIPPHAVFQIEQPPSTALEDAGLGKIVNNFPDTPRMRASVLRVNWMGAEVRCSQMLSDNSTEKHRGKQQREDNSEGDDVTFPHRGGCLRW